MAFRGGDVDGSEHAVEVRPEGRGDAAVLLLDDAVRVPSAMAARPGIREAMEGRDDATFVVLGDRV